MEENKTNGQPQPQGESKTALGVVCALFIGLWGLLIGFCCYKEGTYERQTFFKGYWWTFGIVMIASVVIGIFSGVLLALSGLALA